MVENTLIIGDYDMNGNNLWKVLNAECVISF